MPEAWNTCLEAPLQIILEYTLQQCYYFWL